MASGHWVAQSQITRTYLFPQQLLGRGPMMSTAILSNGTSMIDSGTSGVTSLLSGAGL